LYEPKKSIVLSLVRWRPTWAPAIGAKRSSRPICAPESRPKRSLADWPKLPWPSGRVKRCVTRKASACFGSRSVVGRLTSVKSGWTGSGDMSSSSFASPAGATVEADAAGAVDGGAARTAATNECAESSGASPEDGEEDGGGAAGVANAGATARQPTTRATNARDTTSVVWSLTSELLSGVNTRGPRQSFLAPSSIQRRMTRIWPAVRYGGPFLGIRLPTMPGAPSSFLIR